MTENSPNANQVVINGAFAFDSAFLVNGIDVNDNVLAQPQSLFIEDAIEETQVLTSGISAEYGRFSGGVINAITKSGGNTFSGSGRLNFQNPSWTTATPFETSRPVPVVHTDDLQQVYEGTLGGPLVRDRLWFFAAGRYAALETPRTLSLTGVQVVQNDKSKRGEIKLTGAVAPGHTIQGGYLNNPRTTTNSSGAFGLVVDPQRAQHHQHAEPCLPWKLSRRCQERPADRGAALGPPQRADWRRHGHEPRHRFAVRRRPASAPSTTRRISTGPTPSSATTGSSPAALTNFWSAGGSHETKGGYEWYRSQRTGGGSQSPTQYVFAANFLAGAGGASGPRRDRTADSGVYSGRVASRRTFPRSPAPC